MDKAWAQRNYLNQRTLSHAHSIRIQLSTLLEGRLRVDVSLSCKPHKEPFLKCLAAGLFMNVARRVTADTITEDNSKKSSKELVKDRLLSMIESGSGSPAGSKFKYSAGAKGGAESGSKAPYRTVRDGEYVYIHPSSVLFHATTHGARKLPDYIIFAELLITTKQYVRTLSVIDGSWLSVVAPQVYGQIDGSGSNSKHGPMDGTGNSNKQKVKLEGSGTATGISINNSNKKPKIL